MLTPRKYLVYTYPVDSRLSASVPNSAILPAKPGDWFSKSVRVWSCFERGDTGVGDRRPHKVLVVAALSEKSEDAGCVNP